MIDVHALERFRRRSTPARALARVEEAHMKRVALFVHVAEKLGEGEAADAAADDGDARGRAF